MTTDQQVISRPSTSSAKNSAARVAAEKVRLAKAQPKPSSKAKSVRYAVAKDISDQKRYEMIAEVAYFRAEDREFAPGHEIDDWFAAEKEIDLIFK